MKMHGQSILALILFVASTEGFLFGSKCPIQKYKSTSYITGYDLWVHKDFVSSVKIVNDVAKECGVQVQVQNSYNQLSNPDYTTYGVDLNLYIGHGFEFDLRSSTGSTLCNSYCLSRNPKALPEAKCFLDKIVTKGLTWSLYNPTYITDGTCATLGSTQCRNLRSEVQTNCKDQKLSRELLMALRQLESESSSESSSESNSDNNARSRSENSDEKRKK